MSEIPVADDTASHLLENLLHRIELTYLLRIRGEGFLMVCRLAQNSEPEQMPTPLSHGIHVKVLSRDKSGSEILQISGTWKKLFPYQKNGKIMEFMSSIKRKPIFITGNPGFHEGVLRIAVLGEQRIIASLLEGMKSAGIPFRVVGAGSTKARTESPLADLTARQSGVLRMAHSLGYYDVPKRARVEDVARQLGLDKGTVGEHLQRAEKHVFDRLLR